MNKTCSRCKKEKGLEEFGKSTDGSEGHQNWCKDCMKDRQKERYKTDPAYREKLKERARAYAARNQEEVNAKQRARRAARKKLWEKNPQARRDYWAARMRAKRAKGAEWLRDSTLKYKYGITLEDERRMAQEQDHRCAICGKRKILVVDHCHQTGQVRGLLCHGCNRSLGMLGDDLPGLRRAVRYLEKQNQVFEPLPFIA